MMRPIVKRISEDICCVRTTNVECTMTIFGQCYNVLNYIMPYFATVSLPVIAKFKLVRTF